MAFARVIKLRSKITRKTLSVRFGHYSIIILYSIDLSACSQSTVGQRRFFSAPPSPRHDRIFSPGTHEQRTRRKNFSYAAFRYQLSRHSVNAHWHVSIARLEEIDLKVFVVEPWAALPGHCAPSARCHPRWWYHATCMFNSPSFKSSLDLDLYLDQRFHTTIVWGQSTTRTSDNVLVFAHHSWQ